MLIVLQPAYTETWLDYENCAMSIRHCRTAWANHKYEDWHLRWNNQDTSKHTTKNSAPKWGCRKWNKQNKKREKRDIYKDRKYKIFTVRELAGFFGVKERMMWYRVKKFNAIFVENVNFKVAYDVLRFLKWHNKLYKINYDKQVKRTTWLLYGNMVV